MPCYDSHDEEREKARTVMLCQACKYLTKDQMLSIKNENFGSLLRWYADHLRHDFNWNLKSTPEREICLTEAKRLQLEFELINDRLEITI